MARAGWMESQGRCLSRSWRCATTSASQLVCGTLKRQAGTWDFITASIPQSLGFQGTNINPHPSAIILYSSSKSCNTALGQR